MIIWKQGPFYPDLGKKVIELPNQIDPGPSDTLIKIDGFNVLPDVDGNFVVGSNGKPYTEDELDAIHTYSIIRMVVNLYEDLFGKTIQWSWWSDGLRDPLLVTIRNYDINARFIREHKCIELDYYGREKSLIYNCRTVDLIAHETGHAILDSLKPSWSKGNVETKSLGESFCDLTAMFIILSQKDLCKLVIEETKGDLTKNSILTLFGVGHGYEKNQYKEIRTAINQEIYNKEEWNSYDYSQVIVGLVYDILVTKYLKLKDTYKNEIEA
ncbi:MAG: hypothetical protein KAQ62_04595, partial [Cyclobacteriaceae bacterium]|nr:hypothetical protein [Cyclobacteriaceae bacterium]